MGLICSYRLWRTCSDDFDSIGDKPVAILKLFSAERGLILSQVWSNFQADFSLTEAYVFLGLFIFECAELQTLMISLAAIR